MRKLIKCKSGFTFIESLITFSIVGIFLALTWATVAFMLLKNSAQVKMTRGHFLAVEGIELAKQIRQTAVNRNKESGFYNAIGSKTGAYIIEASGEEFNLEPGENQQIEMLEEPYTIYCRTLFLEGEDKDEKKVSSVVRWGDTNDCSKGEQISAYSTYLADLNQ